MPRTSLGPDPAAYRIGVRIRALRLGRSMGLVELGRHTGLSASLLSKLETGKSLPTLSTLQRIAMVFSVGLDHFFVRDDVKVIRQVVRGSERLRFPGQPDTESPTYWFESLDYPAVNRPMNSYLAEFEAVCDAAATTHEHPGFELLYVMQGSVGLWHDGVETILDEGDSVYFDAGRPHGYRRVGAKPSRGLVVTVA